MKKTGYLIFAFLMSSCVSAGDKEVLLKDWKKIEPLLVAEAKNNNDCDWKLKKQDIMDVDLYEDASFLSNEKLTCDSSSFYFVTFETYCNGREADSLVSAKILNCDQKYRVFSLTVMEE